jgi:hypothetical protein
MLSVMRNAAFLIAAATGLTPPSAELVAGTSLAGKNLECAYLASRDGWGASDFHRCVDDCGSTLVVCETQRGLTFGGFNPLGYRSTDDYGGTSNAFIFYEVEGVPRKSRVLGSGDGCIYDLAKGGPQFGASDLIVGRPKAATMGGFTGPDTEDTISAQGNLRTATSSPGSSYERDPSWPASAIASGKLRDVSCWVNADLARSTAPAEFSLPKPPSWWPF